MISVLWTDKTNKQTNKASRSFKQLLITLIKFTLRQWNWDNYSQHESWSVGQCIGEIRNEIRVCWVYKSVDTSVGHTVNESAGRMVREESHEKVLK